MYPPHARYTRTAVILLSTYPSFLPIHHKSCLVTDFKSWFAIYTPQLMCFTTCVRENLSSTSGAPRIIRVVCFYAVSMQLRLSSAAFHARKI